jgi:DMSO/TMAO reductase YedYZ molybdopterin-dependent catalytic subunit
MPARSVVRRPSSRLGALVGLLLAAALASIFYLAEVVAGLPFVPYDVFDWLSRVLPGALLTFAIEILVELLLTFGLDVADTAKLAEQLMALAGFLGLGALLGAVFFAAGRRTPPGHSLSSALGLAGGAGLVVLIVSLSVNQTADAGPALSSIWIMAAFLGYGAALSWTYERVLRIGEGEDAAPPATTRREEDVQALPPRSEGKVADGVRLRRLSRRRFLVSLGGATASVTVGGAILARLLSEGSPQAARVPFEPAIPLPNAADPLQPAPGTRPEYTPVQDHYRIDINTRPPRIAEESWSLEIRGLVERPRRLTLAQLRAYPARRQFVTLACISNPVAGPLTGTTLWTGVSLAVVLRDLGVSPEATHVRFTSEDGFHEVIALDLIQADERIMLTYAWNEAPLTREHGFPLRVYIPDRYGMKQPKWITGLELTDGFRPGYWVERGWDQEAVMNATSVIDTVAVRSAFESTGQRLIPVGGIAHAGARGISAVEVRVDDGPWREARLRAPLSGTTWVIWRFDWPFQQGDHALTVRCREGDGTAQIEDERGTHPSGATGLHQEEVDV